MLSDLIQWLLHTVSALGYPGIVVLMAMESSVLPVPSELVMPPAGYLAAKGEMDPWLAILAGGVGSVLGALANYAMAVWIGEPVLRRYGRYLLISGRALDRSEAYFNRHGEISTLIGRLIPVVRHLISIPAGMARMPLGRFIAFTALGATVWCGVLTYIGWLIGQHSGELNDAVNQAFRDQAHHWVVYRILPLAVGLIAGYVLWQRRRRPSA